MPTPYDTLLRLQERKLDDLRREMGAAVSALADRQLEQDKVDAALADARRRVQDEALMAIDPYVAQARARRMMLLRDRAAIKARLADLQDSSTRTFAALSTTRAAMDGYLAEVARAARTAEDVVATDLSAARRMRRTGHRPGSGAARS